MPYSKQTWVDGPTGGTPINAIRLNHIEDGIGTIDATAATLSLPTWIGNTLEQTLDGLTHRVTLMVAYSGGWTVDTAYAADPKIAWYFIGGTSLTPPPTTAGPQVWDHA